MESLTLLTKKPTSKCLAVGIRRRQLSACGAAGSSKPVPLVTVAPVWAEPILLGALDLPLKFWPVWESRKDGAAPFWNSKKEPTAGEVWHKDK